MNEGSSASAVQSPGSCIYLLGCFLKLCTVFKHFISYYLEACQLCGTEGRRNSDIGRVTPFGNDYAANARLVMPRIEGEPPSIKKHFVPCTKIHWSRVGWDT